MPSTIVKLSDPRDGAEYWLEWSTIVDAPTSGALSREEFLVWYLWRQRDERETIGELRRRMERAERHGCSAFHIPSATDVIAGNRAGEEERELSLTEIIDHYRPKEAR